MQILKVMDWVPLLVKEKVIVVLQENQTVVCGLYHVH